MIATYAQPLTTYHATLFLPVLLTAVRRPLIAEQLQM